MTPSPCTCARCAALEGPATDLPRSALKALKVLDAGVAWFAHGVAVWAARRRLARERAELALLDDATLRDIGLARCELDSVRAEAEGRVERTRLRVLTPWP